jgi:PIN domain nuclease of toxin-antitoxin system
VSQSASEVVLDASALLALLNGEPGGEVVGEHMDGAAISAVNLSEVVAKLGDGGMPAESVRSALTELKLQIHPFDTAQAFTAGELRVKTRHLGLSLGDRACLALARQLARPVLTTDGSWKKLRLGIEVRAIR